MFRAFSCPSSGATTTAVAASGLPSELGDSSAVGRGRAGPARPRPTALLPPRSKGKNHRLPLQLLSSWWWAWGRPKHAELYINFKWWTWETVASSWLIYLNCRMIHELVNFKFTVYAFTIILMVQLVEAPRHNTRGSEFDSWYFAREFFKWSVSCVCIKRPWVSLNL
jgi:hypothetical protein